VLMALPLRHP